MVNLQLFQSLKGKLLPPPGVLNQEGAPAYALSPRHQLAQLAATGCLTPTFYADAASQLDEVLALLPQVDAEFVAKTAIHARQAGHMKDMPALLLAHLAVRDVALLAQVFERVVDTASCCATSCRSCAAVRWAASPWVRVRRSWCSSGLLQASEKQLLHAAVGNSPSLADVVKMVHPKPTEAWRAAWFAWLIDKPFDAAALPPLTQAFERFKATLLAGCDAEVPELPFQLLTALPLRTAHWAQIARHGSWQMLRQNLNTFARHGVFGVEGLTEWVAAKLRDPQAVAKARVMPYQLLAAYKAASAEVPHEVREALQDAMELAIGNVPAFTGRVVVCPDVSGSMASPVTGQRGSATSAVRCIDVAALMAAAVLRKNPAARVLPFEQSVVKLALNPRDAVISNAQKLAAIGGGGTNCSAPLALLNAEKAAVDVLILVSDNESWIDAKRHGATQTMQEWQRLKASNPQARLVCIDIQPHASTQAAEQSDVMNIGGFSDAVFAQVDRFIAGHTQAEHWVGEIEKIALQAQ